MKSVMAVAALIVAGATLRAQPTAPPIDLTYLFTVGGAPVRDGSLWLYPDTEVVRRVELAQIRNGVARVHLDATMLGLGDRGQPAPSYLVALHANGVAWFRSPDLHDPMTELIPAIDQLGTFSMRADGANRLVDVPPPVKQSIQALDERGQPQPGLKMRIHTFLSIQGRCNVRVEFENRGVDEPQDDDVHTVVTDRVGRADFVAPLAALALEAEYHVAKRWSPYREVLFREQTVDLEASRSHTVSRRWNRTPERAFKIRLLKPDGSPMPGVVLVRNEWLACGASDAPVAATNSIGEVNGTFPPELTAGLWFQLGSMEDALYRERTDEGTRLLSEPEIVQLFARGELTVTWQPPPK